ncbi:DUF4173 domain-containing protein [Oscillochloris sp. ZM17-4]|uniref:DUF4153 domain-containing protein n=1 Tax=Oscillochloris sp. ZM17-4 TaxID=2866714 RepID=UPI001C731BA5|nr:DUF4173 domain-containing protein [Oscillochloris sp. ZM17-4]MBX0327514.1 DUF4173 domain-containing protein [Oscillochloris sp. ZM17-4]
MTSLRSPNTLLGVALLLGVCADLLFYGRGVGVSAPIFVTLGLSALLLISRGEDRPAGANLWLGAAALSFATWLAVRAEPMLVALNLLALAGLLLLLVVGFRGDALQRLPPVRLAGRAALAIFEIGIFPLILAARQIASIPLSRGQLRALAPVARGALLAAPLLLVFGGLLVAADSVFASYVGQLLSLQLPFDLWTATAHAIIIATFTLLAAGGMIVALAEGMRAPSLPAEGETERLDRNGLAWRFLGSTEAITVLALLDLLFIGFMAVQGAYLFGGLDSLARTGMSFADYARRGFFELLAVAFLALGLLCLLAIVTRRESPARRQVFNAASAAMVLLVLGILASAFQRMWLYELAYGFTRLRLYTHSFMIWLAVVLLLFVAALVAARPQIFLAGGFASALVYLTMLNVVSPDALIVRENMARYQANPGALTVTPSDNLFSRSSYGEEVDLDYLLGLSSDALPELVSTLPLLDADLHNRAVGQLAITRRQLEQAAARDGLPGWHYGRARALAALGAAAP